MIEEIKGGVRLHLFIQPKSSKNEVVGEHNGMLKIKITAPPVDGEANQALIEFLSKLVKLPKRQITLIKGEAGRQKTVEIEGLDLQTAKNHFKI
ncbi:MAG: YggU family protein [Bdellovibrio sp.]|nr:YggU family protein [Bdellovibrio sp.]